MSGYILPLQRKIHTYNHSIPYLGKEVISKLEFSIFEDAENTVPRFIEFYNNERQHSEIDYKAPREVYEEWKESITEK